MALARTSDRPLSATPRRMERPSLASILVLPGFAEGVGAFVEGAMGGQEWVLLMSTTCRELRGMFRLWRWALVDQAIVDMQEWEAAQSDASRRGPYWGA